MHKVAPAAECVNYDQQQKLVKWCCYCGCFGVMSTDSWKTNQYALMMHYDVQRSWWVHWWRWRSTTHVDYILSLLGWCLVGIISMKSVNYLWVL